MYVCTTFPGNSLLYKKVINLCSSCLVCLYVWSKQFFSVLFSFISCYIIDVFPFAINATTWLISRIVFFFTSQPDTYVCICVCLQLVCASLLVFISIENSLLWQRSWLSSVTTLSEQLADSYSQNQFPLSNQCLSTGSLSKRSSTALTTAQISFSTISTGRDERDSVYLSLFCW